MKKYVCDICGYVYGIRKKKRGIKQSSVFI